MARSTSIASSDHNERLEPQILRAAESDDVELLRTVIAAAQSKGQLNDNFLRIALMRSSEKGKINATEYLLEEGTPPDGIPGNRLSPLLRAVQRGEAAIVKLLLKHGATPETKDKKGRTALMTAAWKNHYHILQLLLVHRADVNGKDNRGRNVLHNLAADKECNWGDSVVELLLKQNIAIDGENGQDELKRTPLHWACATGKLRLAEMLLERENMPRANINAVEVREKTSLHIAAAHDRDDIVEMLLKHGADVNAKSDGGWTPLHNACEKGSEKIARLLLSAGAEINAKLLNGMSPLHLAAQGGHISVVRCLLERKDVKMAPDTFGSTPFVRAAQNRRKDIVDLLAPFNHAETLSEDALGACNGFNATIVDFGNFHNENRVKKRTVYELLYARDSINPRKPANTILPQDPKVINFRWIHLPANNTAWVETLLTKWFIEDGAHDVEGFKALERSFSHQHRGQQTHSHFMRPLCHSAPRVAAPPRIPDDESTMVSEQGPPSIVINDGPSSADHEFPKSAMKRSPSAEDRKEWSETAHQGKSHAKGPRKENKKPHVKNNKSPKGGTDTPEKTYQRKPSNPLDVWRQHSPGRKDTAKSNKGNIFIFMPYLHFETHRRRQEMQEAINRAESLHSSYSPFIKKAATYDEMLIRAHLNTSTVSLHVRRTLDQSFYHNIDTQSRDADQVVYRYQTKAKPGDPNIDPKILMVDQLWMWILGKDLIVTCFPQRWQQPKNDPLNVLDSVIEDINSKTRDPVTSVHDLSMIISARCSGVFDRHRMGDEDYQFLDMFESSIGSATDRETLLFKEFNAASAQASAWLQHNRRHNRLSVLQRLQSDTGTSQEGVKDDSKSDDFMRGPMFVDKLLDIGQETDLLAETKDIRDELNMIKKVFEDQAHVLPDLESSICDVYFESQISQRDVKKRFKDQLKTVEMHIKDIDRMDKQAERIYNSITDMLDLKQKHANAFEARFARDQAAGTARQSQTIMVFTIVTIVFLPLSFIAAFFTINIAEFPTDPTSGNHALPLGYVAKYIFGIGFAVSIPLIFIALSLDNISDAWQEGRKEWTSWKRRRKERGKEDNRGLSVLKSQRGINTARSQRDSVDTDWVEARMFRSNSPRVSKALERPIAEGEREKVTGFRIRVSRDVERGLA